MFGNLYSKKKFGSLRKCRINSIKVLSKITFDEIAQLTSKKLFKLIY